MYSIRFKQPWAGWVDLLLDDGRGQRTITCTDACDTLGDLIRALAPQPSRSGKIEIPATDEDRHDYVLSVRLVGDDLEIVAKSRLVCARKPNWKTLVRIRDQQSRVRAAFARALCDVIEPLGPKDYRAWWGHPLPVEEFEKLATFATRPHANP